MAFATLLRKKGYSFDRIGSFIDKDHATIIHYHRNIDMYLKTDDFFRYKYDRIDEEFDSYCTTNRLKNAMNFVERRGSNNFKPILPHYNEELISHIHYINKEKKELSLALERLEIKNKALEISENRVNNIINIIKQRTKIGTEKLIEKKLHVWFNGVYEK
jgi:hypothetical protein